MALTPEDVLNKTFTQTQFRRGYDEREVDDFLDEVVAEMRRLVKDNDELRTQLNDCREGRGLDPVSASTPRSTDTVVAPVVADTTGAAEADERIATVNARADEAEQAAQERIAAAQKRAEDAERQAAEAEERAAAAAERGTAAERDADARAESAQQRAAQAEAEHQQPVASRDEAALMGAGAAGGTSAAGLIALAQRLHDEHVAEGESTRDRLIEEAESRHSELISTAQTRHDEMMAEATTRREEMLTEARERSTGMVHEAQQRKASILESLQSEKEQLEAQIEQLRAFERDYRVRLRGFIEGQLAELEHSSVDAPEQGRADDEPQG